MTWIACRDRLPPCPRDKNALGTEVLIWPRPPEVGASAFYGRRATGKPAFYKYGAELFDITHWQPLPGGPRSAPC